MLGADEKNAPWPHNFPPKEMEAADPTHPWIQHGEELMTVLKSWRKKASQLAVPLVLEDLTPAQLTVLGQWKANIDFPAVFSTTAVPWGDVPPSNIHNQMRSVLTQLFNLAWLQFHHHPRYTRFLCFWQLRADIAKAMNIGRAEDSEPWTFWDGAGTEPIHEDMVEPPSSQDTFTPRVRIGHRVKAVNILKDTQEAIRSIIALLSSPNVGAIPNPSSSHPLHQHLPHEDVYLAAKSLFEVGCSPLLSFFADV